MYYCYAWLREDSSPYYIGKGKGYRAWDKCNRRFPPPPKSRIILLKENMTNDEAIEYERYQISLCGRKDIGTGCLRNLTPGGEGVERPCPEWLKKKQSEIQKGRVYPERRGKKLPPEQAEKSRQAGMGHAKAITLKNETTGEIREFKSIREALREIGIRRASIQQYGRSHGWCKITTE